VALTDVQRLRDVLDGAIDDVLRAVIDDALDGLPCYAVINDRHESVVCVAVDDVRDRLRQSLARGEQ
jgi:hypothetical protein